MKIPDTGMPPTDGRPKDAPVPTKNSPFTAVFDAAHARDLPDRRGGTDRRQMARDLLRKESAPPPSAIRLPSVRRATVEIEDEEDDASVTEEGPLARTASAAPPAESQTGPPANAGAAGPADAGQPSGGQPIPGQPAAILGNLADHLAALDVRIQVEARPDLIVATPLPATPAAKPVASEPGNADAPPASDSAASPAPGEAKVQPKEERHGQSHGGHSQPGSDSAGNPDPGAAVLSPTPPGAHSPTTANAAPTLVGTLGTDTQTRVDAAATQQDAALSVHGAVTVKLDDALGHWEVDVVRHDDLLDLVLRGDASVHQAVAESTPELRDHLARQGFTLNRLEFVDHRDGASDPTRAVRGTQNPESGRSTDMSQHSSAHSEARREDIPAWPTPRAPRAHRAKLSATQAPSRRGRLDREA